MKRWNGNWIWLLLFLGFLLGLWLIFYPQINTAIFDVEAERMIQQWEAQVETAQADFAASPATEERVYSALFEAMTVYNETIARENQSGLTGPEAYEQSALRLSDYGLADDAPVGVLSIPAIDLELPLYLGADTENMAKGAAVLGQTSLPVGGENTNCVVAGHRGYRGIPYFRYLNQLKSGDMVYLTNFWGKMAYMVTEIAVIEPDDIDSILIQDGKDMLTLLTCHPYTVGTQRLIVYCDRSV